MFSELANLQPDKRLQIKLCSLTGSSWRFDSTGIFIIYIPGMRVMRRNITRNMIFPEDAVQNTENINDTA